MITPEGIIQRVMLQNLIEKCKFDTTTELEFFYKVASPDGIQERVQYLNSADSLKKFPIYHLVHDDVINEFQLNVDYFDKESETIMWMGNDYKLLKWIFAFKNQYVLTFPNGLKIGNVFKNNLPIIQRI